MSSTGDLSDPGIELTSPALQVDSLSLSLRLTSPKLDQSFPSCNIPHCMYRYHPAITKCPESVSQGTVSIVSLWLPLLLWIIKLSLSLILGSLKFLRLFTLPDLTHRDKLACFRHNGQKRFGQVVMHHSFSFFKLRYERDSVSFFSHHLVVT